MRRSESLLSTKKGIKNNSVIWINISFVLLALLIVMTLKLLGNNNPIANVNGVDIKKDQLYTAFVDYGLEEVLDKLILEELVLQEAEKENIDVPSNEVDVAWDKMKSEFNSEEDFLTSIHRDGYTEQSLRKEVKSQLYIKKLLEPQVKVSEEDIIMYYTEHQSHYIDPERIKVKHVLTRTEEEAENLLTTIKKGGDYSKIMEDLIDGETVKGGELGYFSKRIETEQVSSEKMEPTFEEAAFSLEKGHLSNVVETTQGFHVILMLDWESPSARPFSEVKDEIHEEIVSAEILELSKIWLQELREDAVIKVLNTNKS